MSDVEPQIKILESSGSVGVSRFEKEATRKFRSIDTLIYAVVVAIVVTAISALISVWAIAIDQLHFNNLTYREFSNFGKENNESIQKINELENRLDEQEQRIKDMVNRK